MKVRLIEHTPNPEMIIAAAAKLCYDKNGEVDSLLKSLTPDKVDKFINHLAAIGHGSPFEHVTFTFGIEGVSRALSHQLVRHRAGTAFSQRSQRYCSEGEAKFITPQTIEKNEDALKIFDATLDEIMVTYNHLVELGIPKEDARAILPNATSTSLVMTMNARELMHFFHLRCCTRAQQEIRFMAFEMLRLVKEAAPILFRYAGPSCVKGYCPEGKMTCGAVVTLEELLENKNSK